MSLFISLDIKSHSFSLFLLTNILETKLSNFNCFDPSPSSKDKNKFLFEFIDNPRSTKILLNPSFNLFVFSTKLNFFGV